MTFYSFGPRGVVYVRLIVLPAPPGWPPARCGSSQIQATMNAAMTTEDVMRLRFRPPLASGLVRVSPSVAPSGRVMTKAAQNSKVRGDGGSVVGDGDQ